jgi:hypothetical protein
MRNVARLKMGYYPLPEPEGVKLRSLLSFTGPASVIDPCVGQGTALHLVTGDAEVRRYGVELDAERARIAYFAWPVIDPAMYGIKCHHLPNIDSFWLGGAEPVPATISGNVLISAGDLSGCE